LKPISEEARQEVLLEFNSHIYEYLQENKSKPELEALLNSIENLGAPEEVLKPLVADNLLDKATKTFNPAHVFKALVSNFGNGIIYIVFSFLYLFLGIFIFLIFAKIFGSNVGLYFKDGEFQVLGMVNNVAAYEEVLGHWYIPAMLGALVVVYLFITLLLKLKKSLTKNKLK
jgi:uncharacterized membrane protein